MEITKSPSHELRVPARRGLGRPFDDAGVSGNRPIERLLDRGTAWAIQLASGGRPTLRRLAPMPLEDCPAHPASA